MAILDRLNRAKANFRRQQQYKKAAYAEIKKKEDAAYYKALEKETIKQAEKRAAQKAKPFSQKLAEGASNIKGVGGKLGKGVKKFRKKALTGQGATGIKGPNLNITGPNFGGSSGTDHLFKVNKK